MRRQAQNSSPESTDEAYHKNLSELRRIRGYSILAKGDTPQIVDKETFFVPSQSSDKKYKVTNITKWECECPDHQNRKIACKHIQSIQLFLKLRNSQESQLEGLKEQIEKDDCPHCHSTEVFKRGTRSTQSGIKQIYCCKSCQKRFVLEPLKYLKASAKMVCLAMDCYYKGLSLRDIKDTFKQFYNMDVSHETIRNWIRRFTHVMNEHTKKMKIKTSPVWNADEQMVKTKDKDFIYNWNVMDNQTRFILATHSTRTRNIKDAREVMVKAKSQAQENPLEIITDRNPSYQEGISKAFRNYGNERSIRHTSIVGKRSQVNNNAIENYHTHFREFDKVRRGMNQVQEYSDGYRVFHNFIRKAYDGMTPAERAEVNIYLGENRWYGLLMESMKATELTKNQEEEKSHNK